MTRLFSFAAVVALSVNCFAQEAQVSPSDLNMTATMAPAESSVVVTQGTMMPASGMVSSNCGCSGTYTAMPAAPVMATMVQDCGCGGSVAAPVYSAVPVTSGCSSCGTYTSAPISCAAPVNTGCNCCGTTQSWAPVQTNNCCQPARVRVLRSQPVRSRILSRRGNTCC